MYDISFGRRIQKPLPSPGPWSKKPVGAGLEKDNIETPVQEGGWGRVWKKMILKCTMASICAVTDKTIKQALDFPPTREIAVECFKEILAVAKAQGYDLGEDYVKQTLFYAEKVGIHKDSMCHDIENKTPTEIDFLGGKVVEYAREMGIPTPYCIAMTNLVRAIEDRYM